MELLFWICLFIIVYTFIGYGIVLYLIILIKRMISGKPQMPQLSDYPTVTLIVAAYNEEHFIEQKIANTLALNYPKDKIQFVFVTDGSSDQTPDIVAKYPQIQLMHSPERKGKINAVHKAMQKVNTDITIFTDANTFLNNDAVVNICRHYTDASVGAVSGEKRVHIDEKSDATAGEGFYWKYESKLKTWDAELYSVVGAAGELFSIRTNLYVPVPADTVLDDFMISLLIAEKGYRIAYEPQAYATETSSENIKEELKRKIRIAAGGIQSILRLKSLMNPFRFPVLSFQYISHRVLRWTITPFCMMAALFLNAVIALQSHSLLYSLLLFMQCSFYMLALLGWLLESRQMRVKLLFIPYYFCMMNYAVLAGIYRYCFKTQSAVWEKAKRK